MIYDIVKKLDSWKQVPQAHAHCDVPCGIYDPIAAQIAALTVVRMMDIILKQQAEGDKTSLEYINTVTRAILIKEEHAEKCKHETRVIMGDFIKENHLADYPDIPKLIHKIMQLGSACRQTVNRESGLELVDKLNTFAEIFWKIKGVATKRAKAPYAPNLELVYPNL